MKLVQKLTRFLVTHRMAAGLAVIALTIAAAATASGIQFEFSPQAFYAGEDDLVEFSEAHKERFGYEDAILVLVLEATGDADVLEPAALEWQSKLADLVIEVDGVEDVEGVVTIELPKLSLLSSAEPERIRVLKPGPVDQDASDRVRRRVDKLRMLNRTMISEDRTLTSILVFCSPELRGLEGMKPVALEIRDLLESNPPPDGFDAHLTGLPALRVDIVHDIEADQLRLFPLSALLFLVALMLVFRRPSLVLLTLAAVGTGVVWSIAGMVLMGQSFNLMSSIMPTLLLIIGISNSVHIVGRFLEENAIGNGDSVETTWHTMQHMCVVCLLTTLTTAIGFGSLLTARSIVLKTFAWQAAIGMACLFCSIVVVFTVVLPFVGRRLRRNDDGTPQRSVELSTWLSRVTTSVGMIGTRHPAWAMVAVFCLIGGAFWVSRGVMADSSFLEMYDETHHQTRLVRLLESKMSGIVPIEISLEAEDETLLRSPDIYRRVFNLTQDVRAMDGVTLVRSYPDIFQEVYAQFKRSPELAESVPDDQQVLELRIRVSGKLARRESEAVRLDGFITEDRKHGRILIRMADTGTARTLDVVDQIEQQLASAFPEGSGITYRLSGDAYLNAVSMDRFIRDLFTSLFCAAIVIFGVISVLFRSPRIGLIAVLPNLVPLVFTFGYIGLQGYELNAGNVIVFAISLGIGIDDTIHFLARYREETRKGSDVQTALRRTLEGTGQAIVVTSLLVVSGLCVLMYSDFVPTRRFAELTAITMLAALGGVVLLLPPCLVLFWKDTPASGTPDSPENAL